MTKFRSTLLVVATAFVAAACGDKVTVAGPATSTTATPKVNSVTVAPSSATLNIGDVASLTAAVNADAGLATTVTWKSSDASKASVDATGKVTGVAATPGVAVCATSTVDTGKIGCASVIVTGAAAIVPATVSIASVTVGGNLNTPVNPAAVVGTIDVKLNIAPGNQTPSRVDLLIGTTVVGTQGFTATQAAALRSAADEAIAAQSAFPSVVLSVNTAAFSATTGTPSFVNGSYTLGAKLYTTQGGSTTAAANATQSLTFANVNTFSGAVTLAGTTNTANNPAGFRYSRGDIAVSVLPVMYTAGVTVASASVAFGNAIGTTCQSVASAAIIAGTRTAALTAPATGSFAWTATLLGSGATASSANVVGYEADYTVVTCPANSINAGESVTVAAAQNSAGNPVITAPVTIGAGIRLDNLAPAAPLLVVNPNGRANNWINDAVAFNAVSTGATSNNWIAAAITDAGVGGVTYAVRTGASIASAVTGAALTNATTLAPSATNATYCAAAYSSDALGNTSANPGACNTTFGLDRAAPTIAYSGGITANSRFAAAPGAGNEFIVTVSDTGLVGNSGLLPATPVKGNVIFRGNGNTSAQACFVGAIVSSVCTQVALAIAPAAPLYGTATMAATPGNTVPTEGYYTFSGTAFDAAGNSAVVTSRTTVVDATLPSVGTTSAPLTVPASTYTFNASAFVNENLDIQSYFFSSGYAGAPAPLAPASLSSAPVAVNGYNATPFINTNYAVSGTFNLPAAIQANAAAGLTPLSAVTTSAVNQANSIFTGGSAAPIPTFTTAPVAIATAGPTGLTGFSTPALAAGILGVSSGISTAATAARPVSVTVTTTSTGPTATYNNPFGRVDFYGLNVVTNQWLLIGTTTASALVDNGVTRVFTYNVSLTGATVFATLGGTTVTINPNVIALGVKADGSVGMLSLGALALNIVY